MVREASAAAARRPAARCPSPCPPATSWRRPPLRLPLPPPLLRSRRQVLLSVLGICHPPPLKCPGQDLLALLLTHHSSQQPWGRRR